MYVSSLEKAKIGWNCEQVIKQFDIGIDIDDGNNWFILTLHLTPYTYLHIQLEPTVCHLSCA